MLNISGGGRGVGRVGDDGVCYTFRWRACPSSLLFLEENAKIMLFTEHYFSSSHWIFQDSDLLAGTQI